MRLNPKKAVERLLPKTKSVAKRNAEWTMLEHLYEIGMECKESMIQRWVLNLAFLAGRQYTFFNSSANILQNISRVKGRRRRVDNQLLPHVRRQIADFIRTDPIMSVVPNTTDDADIRAAKLADAVAKGFWHNDDMKSKLREIGNWIYSCGNAFLDDVWDPKRGPIEVNTESGHPEYLGDVTCTVWSPFEICVPAFGLNSVRLDQMPWVIKSRWFTLEWIANQFGAKGKTVVAESVPKIFTDINALTRGNVGTAFQKMPGAMVHWLYLQPNVEYSKGLFLVASNTVVLEKDNYPFNFYHLEHFKDIEIPGSFWGKATMEDGIPLQVRWNNTVNDIDEYNRTMAKGKLLVPRGAGLEIKVNDQHGQELHYKPVMGHKPDQLDLKNAPTSLREILIITKESIDNLFAHHEVTRGTNKSDIRSGEMVSLLQEQDSYANIPSHTYSEERLEKSMSRVLQRIRKGYSAERTIAFLGTEGEWTIYAFKGADLRGNTDVKVKRQSTLPDSRIAREASILRRYEAGLYGDPTDGEVRRHVMNMLDDAVVKDIYSDTRLDESNARRENMFMAQPQIGSIPVNNYDNHQIHLREHTHFQKSGEYQKLKFEDPMTFALMEAKFIEHNMKHQKFIEMQMQAMIAQQMLLAGGGAQKGESKGGSNKRAQPSRNVEQGGRSARGA